MENEKILREILANVRETKEMVLSMNKQRRWSNFVWIIKWLLLAGVAYSAYLAATPYINTYNQTIENINNLNTQVNQLKNVDNKSFTDFIMQQVKRRVGGN